MPPAKRRPNWDVWANVPGVKAWEAVALSLDIEPKKIRTQQQGWMGGPGGHFSHNEGDDFDNRLEVLCRNISGLPLRAVVMGEPDQCVLAPGDFVRWALTLNWAMPPEMIALASSRAASDSRTNAGKEQEMSTAERNSLLKLVIGMAVRGYRYDPAAGRSEIVAEIAGDLEKAGVGLDPDTVRKYLREAAALLSQGKKK